MNRILELGLVFAVGGMLYIGRLRREFRDLQWPPT